jgi:hypothetical protein
MMSLPRKIGMTVSLAAQWRGATDFSQTYGKHGLSVEQSDHVHAFYQCVAISNRYIRKHAGSREVATVVAENIPEMHRFLKSAPRILMKNPIYIPQKKLRETISDKEAGYIMQSGDVWVTRIRNSVHFVDKAEDPLVQVADACAFGFRRFFANEKFGVEFVRSMLGNEAPLRTFASPGGAEYFWQQP